MSEKPKEELKIKDLLVKLQVLTNGLIEERKKSQSYLDRVKEYEDTLQKKDSEIVELRKEKFDLKSKLTLEKSKQIDKKNDSYFSSLLNKIIEKPVDESKVGKLEEKINQLTFENKDLTQRLMEEKETFDQQKIKFQTMLTIQKQQMEELKKDLENSKKEKPKETPVINNDALIAAHKDKIDSLKKQFNLEKDEYEKQLAQLKNELKEEREKSALINNYLTQYKEAYEAKNYENVAMKKQVSDLDAQLNKAKIDVRNSKLSPKMFQVERIKDGIVKNKKVMTITFQYNQNKNACEVVFKRMKHGGKVKEDVVNIIDLSTFKVNEKKKDNIEVVFTVSFITFNLLLNFDIHNIL